MDRRTFLGTTVIGAAAQALGFRPAFSLTETQSLFVVFTDIGPETPEPVLRRFVSSFAREDIPFTISLDVAQWQGADPKRTAPLRELHARLIQEYLGLSELSIHIQDVGSMKPYFQSRAAFDLKAALGNDFFAGLGGMNIAEQIVTATDQTTDPLPDLKGLRASGFRNLLMLPTRFTRPNDQYTDREQVLLSGGGVWRLGDTTDELQLLVESIVELESPAVLQISLESLEEMSESQSFQQGTEVSQVISRFRDSGRIIPMTPSDYHLQGYAHYQRKLSIVLDERQNEVGSLDELRAWLVASPIQISEGNPVESIARPEDPRDCGLKAQTPSASFAPSKLEAGANDNCNPSSIFASDEITSQWVEPVFQLQGGTQGLDGDGHLHVGQILHIETRADILAFRRNLSAFKDTVVYVSPTAPLTSDDQRLLISHLARTLSDGATQGISLRDYLQTITPDDPVFAKFRRQRNLQAATATTDDPALDSEALMADARSAWRYLDELEYRATGLTTGTIHKVSGDEYIFDRLTMWDIGSLLLGLEAALRLGLVEEEPFLERTAKIISVLPETEMFGLTLPCSEIDTKTGRELNKDFNGCDVARLLSAFDILRKSETLAPLINEKVAKWDLAKSVENGIYHNISDGYFEAINRSHCAHYASRSWAKFGLTVDSPYWVEGENLSEADKRMTLLYQASELGGLGAEPLLLDALEMGWSDEIRYLADVLFTEQAHSHAVSGKFVSVSEVPLNESPWFIYQGLDLGSATEPWSVTTLSTSPKHATQAFKDSVRMLSTKAAFLWYALHPHPYSQKLLEHVRDRARSDVLGYVSGIRVETDQPTENYFDLNTNAIILQAIAHVLVPRAEAYGDTPSKASAQ